MAWDEGKPLPASDSAKKSLAREMLGGKPTPGESESETVDSTPLDGKFKHARIIPAGNGYTLEIDREIENAKSIGGDNPIPDGESNYKPPKEYKTVHMKPEHLVTELKRHLVKGQTGSE
jgi:hypothetical protein